MTEVLPLSPFKKILKSAGVRVSQEAVEGLAEITEELGFLLVEEALAAADKDQRKTLRKADIEAARRALW